MKFHVRALIAAAGGFAIGYAFRDRVQRAHEQRKMRQLEHSLSGADVFGMGGPPFDLGDE